MECVSFLKSHLLETTNNTKKITVDKLSYDDFCDLNPKFQNLELFDVAKNYHTIALINKNCEISVEITNNSVVSSKYTIDYSIDEITCCEFKLSSQLELEFKLNEFKRP